MVDFNAIIHIVSMTFLYAMGATIAEIIVMKPKTALVIMSYVLI